MKANTAELHGLQPIPSPTGDVTENDVKLNKIAMNSLGKITGSLDLSNLIPSNIVKDVVIAGITGDYVASDVLPTGNATEDKVLAGKTFTNGIDTTLRTGTMVERGAPTFIPGQAITPGHYSGGTIPKGYKIGDRILGANLQAISGTMGAEVWNKTAVASVFGSITIIAADKDGNIYVSNPSTGATVKTVTKLAPDGSEIWNILYASARYNTRGIDVDDAGNVYVGFGTGTKSLCKFDSNGGELWSKTAPTSGYAVKVNKANGDVYATFTQGVTNTSLVKFDTAGTQVWADSTTLYQGYALSIDVANDALFVSYNSGSRKIRKLNLSGTEYTGFVVSDTGLASARNNAIDSSLNIYTAWNQTTAGTKTVTKHNGTTGAEIFALTDKIKADGLDVSGDKLAVGYYDTTVVGGVNEGERIFDLNGTELFWNGSQDSIRAARIVGNYVYFGRYNGTAGQICLRKLNLGSSGFKIIA